MRATIKSSLRSEKGFTLFITLTLMVSVFSSLMLVLVYKAMKGLPTTCSLAHQRQLAITLYTQDTNASARIKAKDRINANTIDLVTAE